MPPRGHGGRGAPVFRAGALPRPLRIARLLAVAVLSATAASAQSEDHAVSGSRNRALGVDCAHCHAENDATDASRPAYAIARRMVAMTGEINERLASARGGRITCWTCHGGQRVPARVPRDSWERMLAAWPAGGSDASDDVKLRMAVYSASVGRTCAGCHDDGGRGGATEEAVEVVRLMNSFFPILEKYVPPGARTQCFMCHKGRPHPQTVPQ